MKIIFLWKREKKKYLLFHKETERALLLSNVSFSRKLWATVCLESNCSAGTHESRKLALTFARIHTFRPFLFLAVDYTLCFPHLALPPWRRRKTTRRGANVHWPIKNSNSLWRQSCTRCACVTNAVRKRRTDNLSKRKRRELIFHFDIDSFRFVSSRSIETKIPHFISSFTLTLFVGELFKEFSSLFVYNCRISPVSFSIQFIAQLCH